MSTKLFVPLEQVKKGLNLSLSETVRDHDIYQYILAAQTTAETYIKRSLDGEKSRTERYSGNNQRVLVLDNRPIRSITSFNIDNSHEFTSDTLLASGDYDISDSESGLVSRVIDTSSTGTDGSHWPKGDLNIKAIYKAGWIAEKTVVSSASPNATHTIADDLESYGQEFSLFIHTSGTFSQTGSISITGEDENSDSFTETITPYSTDLTNGKNTTSFSLSKFTKITVVDSSALTGGEVRITATSVPNDLRMALQFLAMHFYKVDQFNQINVSTRSAVGESETVDIDDYPDVVNKILDSYKDVSF